MIENASSADRKNIFDLRYLEDAQGNDLLCYPNGFPYTGVVFEALPSGSLTAEFEVKDGLKHGVDTEYYSEGYPESISHYREGWLHGEVTYYYPGGGPKEKSVFEYEILTEQFQWDEAGNLLHHRAFGENDENFKLLERMRRKYQW
jgi:antitoxin component YwqK of YwqJK toxin-antitoxin module